jgi:hypothetical protein
MGICNTSRHPTPPAFIPYRPLLLSVSRLVIANSAQSSKSAAFISTTSSQRLRFSNKGNPIWYIPTTTLLGTRRIEGSNPLLTSIQSALDRVSRHAFLAVRTSPNKHLVTSGYQISKMPTSLESSRPIMAPSVSSLVRRTVDIPAQPSRLLPSANRLPWQKDDPCPFPLKLRHKYLHHRPTQHRLIFLLPFLYSCISADYS